MVTSLWGRRSVLCAMGLIAALLARTAGAQTPPQASSPGKAGNITLAAPYGVHTDDLDGMIKRHNIRALVLINPTGFFYDNGQPMGVNYEALRDFQTFINQKLRTRAVKVEVTFLPVRPDQVEAALMQGVGDVVAYALVVTPQREQLVDFTTPLEKDVKQMLVTGPNFGNVSSVADLGGKEVYVNPLTVNYQRLQQINDKLRAEGKPLIHIQEADKNLQEDDLIQMVNAGLLPATVAMATRAGLWSQVFPQLKVHSDVVIASGEQVAWAVRKNNPQLKQMLDEFIAPRALGTSFGNTLLRRYLQSTEWVRNATSPEEMKKFAAVVDIFKKYAGDYDFDYLLIVAQGYQESLLNQNLRSPGGAVGIMQVMPNLAAAAPINVPDVYNTNGNIEAGVKMLRSIEDKYLNDPAIDPINRTLLAFASYNAGPNRIARLREQAPHDGLDPNKWFDNMELMVAKNIGEVTVMYVDNVYKYYVAYKLALEQSLLQKATQPATPH